MEPPTKDRPPGPLAPARAARLRPPDFLQYLIVFTGSGMACTFLAPTVLALYWRRATRAGALAGLVSGFLSVAVLYVLGWAGIGKQKTALPVLVSSTVALMGTETGQSFLPAAAGAFPGRVPAGPAVEPFAPVYWFDLDPIIYGLVLSFTLAIVVSWVTRPGEPEHVDRYFLEKR